jgi:GT2 family glycosyltransferase
MTDYSDIGVVAIGRNEGTRLVACLASLSGRAAPIVYVDSGSTDGSIAVAEAAGVEVVHLNMDQPFTAARARNAGYARVREISPEGTYVQFIDGDCELHSDWLPAARAAMDAESDLAVVCGRRREKYPQATYWNGLIDAEWDASPGEVAYCGGDALMRRSAVDAVGGYDESLIAGEEPEMCYRMRQVGWRIRRISAEMTRHDAAMVCFSQWWQRSRRAGYTFAEGAARYGMGPERYRVRNLLSTLFWAIMLPVGILLGAILISPWVIVLALIWPLQIWRMSLRGMPSDRAAMSMLGKFAEAVGVLNYTVSRVLRRRAHLIEYK